MYLLYAWNSIIVVFIIFLFIFCNSITYFNKVLLIPTYCQINGFYSEKHMIASRSPYCASSDSRKLLLFNSIDQVRSDSSNCELFSAHFHSHIHSSIHIATSISYNRSFKMNSFYFIIMFNGYLSQKELPSIVAITIM